MLASTSASSRAGSSAVASPFTVNNDTSPVSPKARTRARTLPFTEVARTGPADVSASTSPLMLASTSGAVALATCTAPLTVLAPSRTRLGRRTVKSTATSLRCGDEDL